MSCFFSIITEIVAQGESQSDQLFLRGSYWTTEEGNDTQLIINNPLPELLPISLTLYADSGSVLVEKQIRLQPAESANLSLLELVKSYRSGHLKIGFPRTLGRLPATLVVTNGADIWPIDVSQDDLEMNEREPNAHPALYRALIPVLGDQEGATSVAVSNSGQTVVWGRLTVENAVARTVRWMIPPSQSKVFRILHSESTMSDGLPISVDVEETSGAFRIAGFSRSSQGRTFPVQFEEQDGVSSGEAAGFFWGKRPMLLLWNASKTAIKTLVMVVSDEGATRYEGMALPSGEVTAIDIRRSFGLGTGSSGAVTVDYPGGAEVLALVVSPGQSILTAPLEDTGKGVGAHSFPVRLGSTENTRFLFFNPNSTELGLNLFLLFGDVRYTHPLDSLKPGQMVEVDLLQARDQLLEGQGNNLIPEGAQFGQAKVVIKGKPEKMLTVMALLDQLESGLQLAFQSCPLCAPYPQDIYFSPDFALGFVSTWVTLPPVWMLYSDYSVSNATYDVFYSGNNPSVADVLSNSAFLHSPGFVNVEAEYLPEFFIDSYCAPILGILAASLLLQSQPPPVCSINSPSSIMVGENVVQLMTTVSPAGTLTNWRTVQGNTICIPLNPDGKIGARTPGQSIVQMTCNYNGGGTADSNQFTVTAQPATQFIRVDYAAAANNILNGAFSNAANVTAIKNRVQLNLRNLFSNANVVFANQPTGGVLRPSQSTATAQACKGGMRATTW